MFYSVYICYRTEDHKHNTFAHCGAAPPFSFLLTYIALGFMETTSLELSGVTVKDSIGFLLYSGQMHAVVFGVHRYSLVPRPPMHPMQSGNDTSTPVDDIPQRVDWRPAQSL